MTDHATLLKAALVVASYGKSLEAMASATNVKIDAEVRRQLKDVAGALQLTAEIISAHTCEAAS